MTTGMVVLPNGLQWRLLADSAVQRHADSAVQSHVEMRDWTGVAAKIQSSLTHMASLCADAQRNENYHLDKKTNKSDHYRFLYSARADCVQCVQYWVEQGLDPFQGTLHHPDWNAIEFARHFNATRLGVTGEEFSAWWKIWKCVDTMWKCMWAGR